MSDESAASPGTSSTPSADGLPSERRVSKSRPRKKATKSAKRAIAKPDVKVSEPAPSEPKSSGFPEFAEPPEAPDAPAPGGDWPEPEAPSSGVPTSPENPKRKRRRKKGKGNGTQNTAPPIEEEGQAEPVEAPSGQATRQTKQLRQKLDPEMLAKCAWKIYLAEISEEGVALVSDSDAKELSRRCFRLAEIFMEEQARHR